MALDELTLTLSSPDGRVAVESLASTLDDALELLRSVSADVVASGVNVRWEVTRTRTRHPLQIMVAPYVSGARASVAVRRQLIRACMAGVKQIEETAEAPAHFNASALDAAKRLAARPADSRVSVSWNGKESVTLTENAARHIDAISEKARRYSDRSTIEGRLEIVSVHEQRSFFVSETLTGRRIECFGNDAAFDQALAVVKTRPRVEVTGLIHYRDHVPTSIEVEQMRVMPSMHDLPQPREIGPINLTDGVPSEEFVQRQRHG